MRTSSGQKRTSNLSASQGIATKREKRKRGGKALLPYVSDFSFVLLLQFSIKDKISKKELVRLVENLRRKARNFSVAFECFLQLEKLNTQPPTKKETRKWNHYVMMLGNKPERVDYIQNLLAQVSGQVDKLSKRAGEVRMIGMNGICSFLCLTH